jgi:hypothetical protein
MGDIAIIISGLGRGFGGAPLLRGGCQSSVPEGRRTEQRKLRSGKSERSEIGPKQQLQRKILCDQNSSTPQSAVNPYSNRPC